MSAIGWQDVAFHQVLQKLGAGGPVQLQEQAGLREQVKRKGALKEQPHFVLCSLPHSSHPLPGVAPAPPGVPGSSQATVSTRLFHRADLQ